MSNNLFPIFLKLEQLNVLIVGGGYVGLEKLTAVLANSPQTQVWLAAPEIRAEIRELAALHTNVTLLEMYYEDNLLTNKDLVIVGTNVKAVNLQVQQDCKARKILVNVADTPNLCDFYLSSVVKKGDLKIAISTNGKSPTFAKRFREVLEEILPDSLQETLDNLVAIRNKLRGDFQDKLEKLNEITKVMK
ncbi:MAG: bifunctional precorrin-2 dehydrogenase/sirohydrochlorin ferrochelatase [Runella slithyformis]|nr:MAG: bifunctional precorrin-2 dehydrogenase/sirohydrochlorin ferrochelatase [Runella slithyformis]TAF24557.1 MAG: bifunctional precorrin-2 dehydrogenase/sirohydrochlorin ferrochelatase [Runella slithyformis]TAF49475.1 MAG: bifunctional precorrin-2 dehydrogenase/sirohydrochlorin ferrochelatase [Runella slithyformis]TAF79301.1 MAG: bifunctional precorrin-2 dehydrogenase/sirohydrochlorin ferrochelatase [Runella slithyformis]